MSPTFPSVVDFHYTSSHTGYNSPPGIHRTFSSRPNLSRSHVTSAVQASCCFYTFSGFLYPKDRSGRYLMSMHVISPYFRGSSLYFAYFCENLPTKIFRISYLSYISPYLEFQISLPKFKNSLLCLIILPIWKRKSPSLSSGMYHMSVDELRHEKINILHMGKQRRRSASR